MTSNNNWREWEGLTLLYQLINQITPNNLHWEVESILLHSWGRQAYQLFNLIEWPALVV